MPFFNPGLGFWPESTWSVDENFFPQVDLQPVTDYHYKARVIIPKSLWPQIGERKRYVMGVSPVRSELNFFWYMDLEWQGPQAVVRLSRQP